MLLFLAAHPDDELYAAGLLAALAARRVEVHLLCLTGGEGGATGGVATRDTLGRVREAELRASAAALGIARVEMLGHVDPEPSGTPRRAMAPAVDPDDLGWRLSRIIRKCDPGAVLTHGSNGEYGHPAHRLLHRATLQGVALAGAHGSAPVLYTFNAHAPGVKIWGGDNPDDPADLVFDATPWLDAKIRAFEAHVSQRETWIRPGGPAALDEYVRANAVHETFRRIGSPRDGDPLGRWIS